MTRLFLQLGFSINDNIESVNHDREYLDHIHEISAIKQNGVVINGANALDGSSTVNGLTFTTRSSIKIYE